MYDKNYPGCFITFEGIEGAGKSTQIDIVAKMLKSEGKQVVCTREPGGTELSERIRELLLTKEHMNVICDNTELLLMFAARAQHVHELILPELQAGTIVLCDRFVDSSFAYQGGGRNMSLSQIQLLEQHFLYGIQADLTLLFDLSVENGLQRAGKRSEADRFESEQHDFFERAREVFLSRAQQATERFVIIDAEQEPQHVTEQVLRAIQQYPALT